MVKVSIPARFIFTAAPMPPKPAPKMVMAGDVLPTEALEHLTIGINRAVERQAAVTVDDLTGHPRQRVEGEDRFGNIVGLAQAPERRPLSDCGQPGRIDGTEPVSPSRRDQSHLTLIPWAAHSHAATRMIMLSAAFEAQ
jgi:hypothetical protein